MTTKVVSNGRSGGRRQEGINSGERAGRDDDTRGESMIVHARHAIGFGEK